MHFLRFHPFGGHGPDTRVEIELAPRRAAHFAAPRSRQNQEEQGGARGFAFWPKRAPDPKATVYGFRNGQYLPLDANGSFVDDTPYVSSRVAAKAAATASAVARSDSGNSESGFDWLGAVDAVAGAALGGAGSSGDGGGDSMLKSFGNADDSDGGSLLGDAQPFEYQPDMPDGEIFNLAKTVA
ncbi:hypothetical protein AWB75_06792 [Caballeronia catudaia]|uniref:Uncharacterized protein n=1 Tax=Caballeronia catudaia TaxID=1777136 RepID=A0A158DID5_9BURK|nr:hypothetical protein [Caballeronia catudaia]SAK94295.1 hypothetical protein AWB75_06792 [Caballeronia catudaia]